MGRRRKLDAVARRVDATRVRIDNPWGVPVTLFANPEIAVDAEAVEELLTFVSLQETSRPCRRRALGPHSSLLGRRARPDRLGRGHPGLSPGRQVDEETYEAGIARRVARLWPLLTVKG